MKTAEEIINNLEKHSTGKTSDFVARAREQQKNKSWIRLSKYIAVITLSKMEELGLNQTQFAKLMGCSQQYISKILKGNENLSLETISKIEECLNISFFEPKTSVAAEPSIPFGIKKT